MMKFIRLCIALPLLLAGCKNYDDGPVKGRIDELENRVTELEALCRQMNTNIASVQRLIVSMQEQDSIDKVVPIVEEGQTIGWTILFAKGAPITLYNGQSGSVPQIGVRQEDGTYYWTIEGEWLTDDAGNKIKAEGKDGSGGSGNEGVAPLLKIEEGFWWVSTDGGTEWNKLGQATGDKGEDGDSFLRSLTEDDTKVTFTLADGTQIVIPKAARLRIELETERCNIASGAADIPYRLVNVTGTARVEALATGAVKARIVASGATEGIVAVVAADPAAVDEYTKVLVFASDDARTVMSALVVENGVMQVAESFDIPTADEQQLTIPVETDRTYSVAIEQSARTWIEQVETRAARVDNLVFRIAANTGAARTGTITLQADGNITRRIVVAQAAGTTEPVDPPVAGLVEVDKLYGYAEGTTGGNDAAAANTHHFDNGDSFRQWLYLREKNKDKTPALVWLSGKFDKTQGREGAASPWFDIKRTGNLTILGTEGFVMENVGFFIKESSNVIIRNIYIKQPEAENGADAISMQESSNVWIDHCTFESVNQTKDFEDGSCDVTHGSYNVTVSWCHFIKTQKTCLVGHSNTQTGDTGITVTFHHNFFDLSSSRHPRVRFGRAHVYNNFYNKVTTYGAGSAYGAMVLVEDNLFDAVRLPTDICTFPAKPSGSSWVSNLQGSEAGYLFERGNVFLNKPDNAKEPYPLVNVQYKSYNGETLATPLAYDDFKPAYAYVVDNAADLAAIVPQSSGAGKLAAYAAAPIPVDNGNITPDTPNTPDTPVTPEQPGGTDLGEGWTLLSVGDAAGAAAPAGGAITLTGQGKFEGGRQTFAYVYREITGDFTATVQVDSFTTPGTSNQSLAGLMLTPDPTATETAFLHVMAAQGPGSIYCRSVRTTSGANASRGTLNAPANITAGTPAILKVERKGDECSISYSLDGGATFGNVRTETIASLPEKVMIGLAVSSGKSSETATARFSNLTIDQTAVTFPQQ